MSDLTTSLGDRMGVLRAALEQWEERDTAAAGRVGRAAVDAVDALLRDLYLLRGRLVQEVRQAGGTARRRVA